MSYKWTIGLIIASHLIVVEPAEAEGKHPFKRAPVTWISRSSSWDARKYHRYIREYQEAFGTEDLTLSMFGYFDLDELIPVSKPNGTIELVIVVIGTTDEDRSRPKTSFERGARR